MKVNIYLQKMIKNFSLRENTRTDKKITPARHFLTSKKAIRNARTVWLGFFRFFCTWIFIFSFERLETFRWFLHLCRVPRTLSDVLEAAGKNKFDARAPEDIAMAPRFVYNGAKSV